MGDAMWFRGSKQDPQGGPPVPYFPCLSATKSSQNPFKLLYTKYSSFLHKKLLPVPGENLPGVGITSVMPVAEELSFQRQAEQPVQGSHGHVKEKAVRVNRYPSSF